MGLEFGPVKQRFNGKHSMIYLSDAASNHRVKNTLKITNVLRNKSFGYTIAFCLQPKFFLTANMAEIET